MTDSAIDERWVHGTLLDSTEQMGATSMTACSVTTFTDADEYIAATRAVESRIIRTRAGPLQAELTKVQLDRVWLQRGAFPLQAICHATSPPNRFTVMFLTDPALSFVCCGGSVTANDLMIWLPQDGAYVRGERFFYSALSLPISYLEAIRTLTGRDIAGSGLIRNCADIAVSQLRALHKWILETAVHAPHELADPEIVKAIEDRIIRAVAHCLSTPVCPTDLNHRARVHIIERFEEFLETNQSRPIYLAEVCTTLGISERTLRRYCSEQFGMGPQKYLAYRRINLVHREILRTAPVDGRIYTVASAFGVTELGRFAGTYRQLFDELPSATLKRATEGVLIRG